MSNSSKFISLLERQKESGLSVRGFCSNEGIAPSTFYYWQKKIRKSTPGPGFIPMVVQTRRPAALDPTSHRLAGGMDTFPMEITYPNGTTLRIRDTLDLAGLRSLVLLVD
jgi:hypothetical protein